jgi:hypothetical protein
VELKVTVGMDAFKVEELKFMSVATMDVLVVFMKRKEAF